MNRAIDFTHLGGLYTYQDTLEFLQQSVKENIDALAAFIGDKIIIGGVTDNGDGTFEPGFITYQGQVFPFLGGLAAANVIIETITTQEQYDDGVQRDCYTVQRAKFAAIGGFPFTDLKRLPLGGATIKEALSRVQTVLKNIVNFEDEVIINGCQVSAVDTGGHTLAIASGLVLFAGEYVATPAYAGAYPAYLKQDGSYTTVLPVAGLFIKFDPYSSQHYKDVKRRWETISGKVEMYKVLSDRFDVATGEGKWEWLGFKICDDVRGRVPLGFDRRTAEPADGIWDFNYTDTLNYGGEKKHTLVLDEIPSHRHDIDDKSDSASGNGNLAEGGDGPESAPGTIKTNYAGGGQSHENRQPYLVLLFIEKI